MAKGNLGNLLQHEVELRLVERLLRGRARRLHLVATHAMAPMSPIEARPPSPEREAFSRVHAMVLGSGRLPASPLLRAWRRVAREERDVADTHYPNTLRLLAAAGVTVEGHACDVDVEVREQIGGFVRKNRWALQVHGDWRAAMPLAFAPPRPGVPWLVTHDPYRYAHETSAGGFIGEADLEELGPFYGALLSQQPRGAVAMFSYAMSPEQLGAFRAAARRVQAAAVRFARQQSLRVQVIEAGSHAVAVLRPARMRRLDLACVRIVGSDSWDKVDGLRPDATVDGPRGLRNWGTPTSAVMVAGEGVAVDRRHLEWASDAVPGHEEPVVAADSVAQTVRPSLRGRDVCLALRRQCL